MQEPVRVFLVPEPGLGPPSSQPSSKFLGRIILQLDEPPPCMGHTIVARPSPKKAVEGPDNLIGSRRPSPVMYARPSANLLTSVVHGLWGRSYMYPPLAFPPAPFSSPLEAHPQKVNPVIGVNYPGLLRVQLQSQTFQYLP